MVLHCAVTTGLHQLHHTPKTPFIIIPRHPVSPGLTNHNHNQRSILSRDPMLPSDWSDAFRCRGRRATELQNTASPRHKCVPRVLGRYLQTRASNEGSRIFTRRRSLLGPSPGWKRLLPLSHLRHYAKWTLTPQLMWNWDSRRSFQPGEGPSRAFSVIVKYSRTFG